MTVEAALRNELTASLFTLLPAPGCDHLSIARESPGGGGVGAVGACIL
jgi:hypothetical protein